jgi:electron transfer flavoprotein alpha subunit
MADIYAYITHKGGVADDSALELVAAAKKIDAGAAVTAIVTGSGADVDAVANEVAGSYANVLKFNLDALAYPNAEVIRKLLVNVLPADAIVLVPHDTFGMDLAPGLSIKLDSAFVADVVDIEGVDGGTLKVIRQEYSGMVSTHVTADISAGAVVNLRPGAFTPDESKSAGGSVEDRSTDAGT